MTKEQAEALVDKKLPELKKLLCLDHMSFDVKYETISEAVAEISMQPDYNHGIIRIHAPDIENEKDLGDCLLHEMLHMILIQFQGMFEHIHPELPISIQPIALRLNTEAQERSVAHLEKILGRDK